MAVGRREHLNPGDDLIKSRFRRSTCSLAAEVQQGGVLTVPQSMPVGDDGRRGVRGQRVSPELVVRGRWEVCRRSVCQP